MAGNRTIDRERERQRKKKRRRRRRKQNLVSYIALAVILIAVVVLGFLGYKWVKTNIIDARKPSVVKANLTDYYRLSADETDPDNKIAAAEPNEYAIFLDDQLIGNRAVEKDGFIYVRMGIIRYNIDDRYRYDEKENAIAVTDTNSMYVAYVGEKSYTLDGNYYDTDYVVAIDYKEDIYVCMNFVDEISDSETSFFTDPNRVLIRYKLGRMEYCDAAGDDGDDIYMRVSGGTKANVVTSIKDGTKLRILKAIDEDWYFVVDDNCWFGYVSTTDVSGRYHEEVEGVSHEDQMPLNEFANAADWVTEEYENYNLHYYGGVGYTSKFVVDASDWNGYIDWQTAYNNTAVWGAVIRVGYRGYADGIIMEDTAYWDNIQRAIASGMKTGVYFFSQATTEEEAIEEANYVLDHVAGYELSLPIYYDAEDTWFEDAAGEPTLEGSRFNNQTKIQYTKLAKAFCETIEAAGYEAGIYANKSWFEENMLLWPGEYEFWVANYSDLCECTHAFSMWQFTQEADLPGFSKPCDLSVRLIEK